MIALADLIKIMPYATARASQFIGPLNDAMEDFQILTPLREAAFLAQLAHESGELRYVRELASGEAYDNRADLGNTDPTAVAIAASHGSSPGPWWKGRGLIQITGYHNYLACGIALNLDLANGPEQLEQPQFACSSAAWFWKSHGLNELADAGDMMTITRRINGGTNGLVHRMAYYETAKEVLGC